MADISGITTPQVDISSYKNALPTGQQTPLQTATQLGALEQQKVNLDQQKLKLMNDRFTIINNELSTLANDTNATRDKVLTKINTLSRMGLVPKEQLDEFIKDIPQDNKQLKSFLEQTLQRGMSILERINFQYGQPGTIDTGQATIPIVTSPRFGVKATNAPIQRQLPPGTPVIQPETGQPAMLGPQGYQSAPGGSPVPLPVAQQVGGSPVQTAPLPPPIASVPVPATPIPPGDLPSSTGTPQAAPNGLPVAQPPASAAPIGGPPRPTGPVTGFAPGIAEAETRAGAASGEQLAHARTTAANYQRDIFPLTQAIPALERLGTKGTGPGTEEINLLKSLVLSNVPGVKESDFNGTVADYDKAKKYLTDFVNQTGNTGTNDKLAAAFAGNPSVGISNAAAVDVAKSALALRKMQQAAILDFERKGLPASQFSRYIAQLTNTLDPRAFGFNLMGEDKQKKLVSELKKNPTEAENFRKSYELAKELGLI